MKQKGLFMYIYESHLGGLYATDEVQDWDTLYCDECGDSDTQLGSANTLEEAWTLIKDETDTFDDTQCQECIHNGDYDYCDNQCDAYLHSGGYSILYAMNFLSEYFADARTSRTVYCLLFTKDSQHVGVYVRDKTHTHEFPQCGCPFSEYTSKVSGEVIQDIIWAFEADSDDTPPMSCQKIADVSVYTTTGTKIIAIAQLNDDIEKGVSWHISTGLQNGWFAFMPVQKLVLSPIEEECLHIALKKLRTE